MMSSSSGFRSVASALWIIVSVPLLASAGTPTGREVMELVDARNDGDHTTQDMEMILIDKRGQQRVRMIRMMRRDLGEDTQTIMFFLSPAPVKDTGFLTYDYDSADRDDDQWLFLPALKKTKRIATGDKSGSFMGSDFTYSDMTDRVLDHYDYRMIEQGEVRGHPVWVVEAIPNSDDEIEETGYTKSVVFVRQDNYVVVRAKNWVKKGKREKYLDVKSLEQIDGIWVPTETHMTTKKGKTTLHKTVLKAHDVRFDQAHHEDLFTVRKLERGP